MKKGFTMIELIFVIVILGILAAVALPRLAATRDDAEISKAASNISTIVSDITAYYTSQGQFSTTVSDMTNVPNPITIKGTNCLTVSVANATDDFFTAAAAQTGLCQQVWAMPGLAQLLTNINSTANGKTAGTIKVGGQGVSFAGPTSSSGGE